MKPVRRSNLASGSDTESGAVGFVLAGGNSSRMGTDKATVLFAGRPLVACAVSLLLEAGLAPSIAGARSALEEFAPVVEDTAPGLGPLGGICSALASTTADWAVFIPVDLPLLPASLLAFIVQNARTADAHVTLCSAGGFVQSLPVVLRRDLLPLLHRELESGRSGCLSAFKAAAAGLGQSVNVLSVESLVQSGQITDPCRLPAADWFMNVNASEDLKCAEAVRLKEPVS